MRNIAITALVATGALFCSVSSAQDEPTPEPRDARPKAEVEVEDPAEVARIRNELARLKTERERLTGTKGLPDFSAQVEALSGQNVSPVLAPRTDVLGLRLDEAIGKALANNPDYLVALLRARSVYEGISQERGVFDPVLSGDATTGRSFAADRTGRSRFISGSATLGIRTPIGTELGVTFSETRFERSFANFTGSGLSKSFEPSVSLSITQPLLRNFGLGVNLAGIRIARNSALSSDADLADVYMRAVLAVEEAYWNLVLTEAQLRAQERSLGSSIKFLDDQRKKLEHGAGTRLEVTIAKAGVANTREAVIIAENALESARDQVIRLVSPSSEPSKWDLFIVPLDLPELVDAPPLDSAAAIVNALSRRPDYLRAKLSVASAKRQLEVANNQVLPAVNFVSSFTEVGVGDTHNTAWKSLSTADNYSWRAGFSVELPLFLRSERARARAAQFDVEQAEASLLSLEADVILSVRSSLRDVRTSKARIQASRASRALAKERLEATRVQVETGTAVPRDVLDDLAELARAETAEAQAFINYRLALSRLKLAQGTLLDSWLDVLDPRVRMALDRIPYGDR
jgi:outer membrane protein TolC